MINAEIIQLKKEIDKDLKCLFIEKNKMNKKIYDAINYSLLAGGKRIRPILCMKTYESISGKSYKDIMNFALSLELIHTYSLIHDDLPSMDNDDMRRGKPTNHKVYGEDIAILAGDGLLNGAYEHMLNIANKQNIQDINKYLKAILILAESSGVEGMIGGQVVDVSLNNSNNNIKALEYIHENKTSKLIEASILTGAILGDATDADINSLTKYAKNLGLIFQIKDDILDEKGDADILGKKTGTDRENKKLTYVSKYGVKQAEIINMNYYKEAKKEINKIKNKDISFLEGFIDYIMYREN